MVESLLLFFLPEDVIPDKQKQFRIKQVFKTLRKNEIVGIHVNKNAYNHIKIHQGQIPEEYSQAAHVVRCMNYPDSNEVTDFDPFTSNLDTTMSQVTDINTIIEDDNEDENIIFAFVTVPYR